MMILGKINNDDVRTLIGATTSDITNEEMESLRLEDELKLDLLSWFPDYQALLDSDSLEAPVVGQKMAIEAFCRYFCAETVLVTAPLKFLQKRANGDDQGVRFNSNTALEDHRNLVKSRKEAYMLRVNEFETEFSPAAKTADYKFLGMAVSTPTDVITGE